MPSASADPLNVQLRCARESLALEASFRMAPGRTLAVFGPSGAGKTTLLRLLAGLERPDNGKVMLGSDSLYDSETGQFIPPHRRRVGLVFQDTALFPHLTVAENVAFSRTLSSRGDAGRESHDLLEAFGIVHLANRRAHTLSGGEAKRTALARAIAAGPRLLLLDEPLAGLDRAGAARLLPHLRDLPARFGVATILVSHDVREVQELADDVLFLENGRVVANGPMAELVDRLALGSGSAPGTVLDGTVERHDKTARLAAITTPAGEFLVPVDAVPALGKHCRLYLPAEDVVIAKTPPDGISIRNVVAATIARIAPGPRPHTELVTMAVSGTELRAVVTSAAVRDLSLAPGASVHALIKSVHLSVS